MSKEEIKKEIFKSMPDGATTKSREFEGEYEKSDQHLIKNKNGNYKIIEKSALVYGTLRLDGKKISDEFDKNIKKDGKIEKDDDLCDFICEKCKKLGKECTIQHFKNERGGNVEADYYQRDIEIIENGKKKIITKNYLKPFSLKKNNK
ncbi:MAG: hypothetical protein AAB397_03510 [Patescibacteria group bacterium]